MTLLSVALCLVLASFASPFPTHQKNTWSEYQILAFISSPIVPQQLLLDISTSDIWVYSDDCKNCPKATRKGLNSSLSQSSVSDNDEFTLKFTTNDNDKTGTVYGDIVTDSMLLLPDFHTAKETKQHKFALINKIDGADETVDPYNQKLDGRIGMGLNKKSPTSTVDLFFGEYQKLLCLINVGRNFEESGIMLGQKMLDSNVKYSTIVTSQVVDTNDGKWIVPLEGYDFGKYSGKGTYTAQLSTTTHYTNVPSDIYKQIVRVLKAYEKNNQLLMSCNDRSKAPALELKLKGVKLTVNPEDFVVDGASANECIVNIRPTSVDKLFVLGTTFLDTLSFCLNYDTQVVSFLKVTGYKPQN